MLSGNWSKFILKSRIIISDSFIDVD